MHPAWVSGRSWSAGSVQSTKAATAPRPAFMPERAAHHRFSRIRSGSGGWPISGEAHGMPSCFCWYGGHLVPGIAAPPTASPESVIGPTRSVVGWVGCFLRRKSGRGRIALVARLLDPEAIGQGRGHANGKRFAKWVGSLIMAGHCRPEGRTDSVSSGCRAYPPPE